MPIRQKTFQVKGGFGLNKARKERSAVVLANAIRVNIRRCSNMPLALHHLVASGRKVLNVSVLLVVLTSSQ